nr:MAG TPA: hypothetical protein [Caudoviricetes sp.]DAM70781.1 MAG TPA: hypothetical protein [Caudoviricetes sp.]
MFFNSVVAIVVKFYLLFVVCFILHCKDNTLNLIMQII